MLEQSDLKGPQGSLRIYSTLLCYAGMRRTSLASLIRWARLPVLFTQDDLTNRCLTNESSLIILSVCSWFGAMIKDSLISNVDQRILQFLAKFSDKELHEREIARRIGIAAGSANRALNDLFKTGALKRRREGKMLFYSVNTANPAIIEFKKLVSIMLLEPLVEELKDFSSKVILYGSCTPKVRILRRATLTSL